MKTAPRKTNQQQEFIGIVSTEGIFLRTYPVSRKIYGFQSFDLIGNRIFELIHPDDRIEFRMLFNRNRFQLIHSNDPSKEFRIRQQDGSYKWFEVHAKPMLDKSNNVAYIVFTTKDIDKRIRTAQKIRQWKKDLVLNHGQLKDLSTYLSRRLNGPQPSVR